MAGKTPQILLLMGHQRSGTSMLTWLCNAHPDLFITFELRSFFDLNASYEAYLALLRLAPWNEPIFFNTRVPESLRKVYSELVRLRFLRLLSRYRDHDAITLEEIRHVLQVLYPRAAYVGDKFPDYIELLPRLTMSPEIKSVVIYRDCRDVISSFLRMSETKWKDEPFAQKLATTESLARRWVQRIEMMQKYQESICILQFERLLTNPAQELNRLGDWLGVDGSQFRHYGIDSSRIGSHTSYLSPHDLEIIDQIAGPAMQALGY